MSVRLFSRSCKGPRQDAVTCPQTWAANKGTAGGTRKEPAEARGRTRGPLPARQAHGGKPPRQPEAPTPADGVRTPFPCYFPCPARQSSTSVSAARAAPQSPAPQHGELPAQQHPRRPIRLGGSPRAAFVTGLGQPQGLSEGPSAGLASKGSASAATPPSPTGYQPKPRQGQRAPAPRMPGPLLGAGRRTSAGRRGAERVQHGQDLRVLPCPHAAASQGSQEGVTSSKG